MEIVKKNFVFIKGIVLSFIISIILFYILGIILSVSNVPEKIITPSIIVITGISILIGTSIAAFKSKDRGLLKGGASGLIYFMILYLISSICLKNFEINIYSIIMMRKGTGTPRWRLKTTFFGLDIKISLTIILRSAV